jgi:hypothetical protein
MHNLTHALSLSRAQVKDTHSTKFILSKQIKIRPARHVSGCLRLSPLSLCCFAR